MAVSLSVRGAREHNLRDLDLDLPLGQWIAVVGPSGSGKTSLAFDTIVREGQRRFLGALSARARHFYGKLGRAQVSQVSGLPATIAIGQPTSSDSARSTVGTLTGALDLLRLLFAREAADPAGEALTRSHFSFNHPLGACEACGGIGIEDRVAPERIVADPTKSLRAGALRPTLKNGYTVYSQVTVDVMDQICRAHGFDVDTPWEQLTEEQQGVILFGTKKLKVPFGKHSIESRMRWEGITARPREEGYYRGLVPVIEETLQRNRNPNILRFVESVPCGTCSGSRLSRAGREAVLGGVRLPSLLAMPSGELAQELNALPDTAVWRALRPSLDLRLGRMQQLGLAHLSLERSSGTLSGGEAQRLRLAAQLTAGLGRQLVALDEPTLGLHPGAQAGMRAILDELRALGNTLLVVEHDPDMVRHADHLVRLGPGAGVAGGQVIENAPMQRVADSAEGSSIDPLGPPPVRKSERRTGRGQIVLRGATLHNLEGADLTVQLGAFNVVMGASGAGKSSLVFGTLLPALSEGTGGGYRELSGVPSGSVQAVDARPIGRNPRSTPATWSGLFDLVRKRFAAEPMARELGFGPGRFSYNNKEGRCAGCEGLGFRRVGLHLLEDVELECADCAGGRYAPETLAVKVRGLDVAQVLGLSVSAACEYFASDPPILALCRAMDDLGLGYLGLGHASSKLSRGEAQRVKLATLLGTNGAEPSLLLLDEPDRGLHPSDVELLLRAIDALAEAGHTVLAISHHRHLWAAADHLTEVRDGRTFADPYPEGNVAFERLSAVQEPRAPAVAVDSIRLEGVRTHNLAGIDVTIPHAKLTAIAGVSGSGKSSLAFATLASEAWHRFSESLPFQVRRFTRRTPRPDLDGAAGLAPTLALRQGQARAGERSTVATQSEVGPLLRLLWSRAGRIAGAPCELSAAHFSPDQALGACPGCEGRGVIARCDPELLVTHPELPLGGGALQGTRPGAYFSEAGGQYLATLQAAVGAHTDLTQPWATLSEDVRRVALDGAGDSVFAVTWQFQRGKRSGEHNFEGPWEGFCALVEREARRRAASRKSDEWRAPLADVPCRECGGSGLRLEVAQVTVGPLTLPEVLELPLISVAAALEDAAVDDDQRAIVRALLPGVRTRLDDLVALGLGHLTLGRKSRTLSEGELQRVRLASVLQSGLTGVTLVLDEPASGLHERDAERLLQCLKRLVFDGNTVVVVSHRPSLLRAADYLIELGPGAGATGGQLVAAGSPAQVLAGEGPTAKALAANALTAPVSSTLTSERIVVRGARANNLRDLDVEFPSAGFVCVTGVSGSGKSSLLFDVLERSARAGAPVNCSAIEVRPKGVDGQGEGGSAFGRFAEVLSSRRIGSGHTVLSSLDLLAPLQALYFAEAKAQGSDLKKAAFSFLSPSGRCEACKGSGLEEVPMDFVADLSLPCPECAGRRYRDSVLAITWQGMSVAEFLNRPVEELLPVVPGGRLRDALLALDEVGLGYLSLGRRRRDLSGGENQRVALAAGLQRGDDGDGPALYLLDEPSTGLHEADLARLASVFAKLAARGHLIVAAEHRSSLIAAADWIIELGPEGGAGGGRLLSCG